MKFVFQGHTYCNCMKLYYLYIIARKPTQEEICPVITYLIAGNIIYPQRRDFTSLLQMKGAISDSTRQVIRKNRSQ